MPCALSIFEQKSPADTVYSFLHAGLALTQYDASCRLLHFTLMDGFHRTKSENAIEYLLSIALQVSPETTLSRQTRIRRSHKDLGKQRTVRGTVSPTATGQIRG
jgi:hypothetical protein